MLCDKFKCVYETEGECEPLGTECIGDMCEELGSSRSDTVKKWDKECESSWQDEASTAIKS